GGQIGDIGQINTDTGQFNVTDTQKTPLGIYLHIGNILDGKIILGEQTKMLVDDSKRELIKKNHSATHLLHAALRDNLGKHVTQKGSLVNDDKLRFDFSHNKSIEKEAILKIEEDINNIIKQAHEVKTEIKSQEEAVKEGAMALFGEKYGDKVRVVSMGQINNSIYSKELCGGTHVNKTSDIKEFKIIKEESVASGVRRIEAITFEKVDEFLKTNLEASKQIEFKLNSRIDLLVSEIKKLGGTTSLDNKIDKNIQIKNLENKLKQLQKESIILNADKNIIKVIEKNNIKIKKQIVYGLESKDLRSFFDDFKKEYQTGVFICASINHGKVSLVLGITQSLLKTHDCRDLIKNAFISLDSKGGGGRQDFSQAGGTNTKGVDEAFNKIIEKI
ncbi:MAG: alanine--tRNA ligase, partial [Pelagibacteraceae bacterium]|nr:alanine--tRNA ligase [Pelagibacteraceae bacterium]